MKKVMIVNDVRWGEVSKEQYDQFIKMLKMVFENVTVPNLMNPRGKEVQAATVQIASLKEAEEILKKAEVNLLVFPSRGGEVAAERLADQYPKTRVAIFTGLIPEKKILWIEKGICSTDLIKRVLFS